MKLPSSDSLTGRSLKTGVQAGIGTIVLTAVINLIVAIWHVPGVPEIVWQWIQSNILEVAGAVGVSSGVMTVIYHKILGTNIPKY